MVSHALVKVVLLIQDLWSTGQIHIRNSLLSTTVTGAVPCTVTDDSSTLVFGPSSWDCGLFGEPHTRTRTTESESANFAVSAHVMQLV